MAVIRVSVVEDGQSPRRSLVTALERSGRFRVETPEVATWVSSVAAATPEVLLLDLSLGRADVLKHLPQVLVASPHTMVAVLTTAPDDAQGPRALAAGAFVVYETPLLDELPQRVAEDHASFQRALNGEEVVAPSARVRRPPPPEPTPIAAG